MDNNVERNPKGNREEEVDRACENAPPEKGPLQGVELVEPIWGLWDWWWNPDGDCRSLPDLADASRMCPEWAFMSSLCPTIKFSRTARILPAKLRHDSGVAATGVRFAASILFETLNFSSTHLKMYS